MSKAKIQAVAMDMSGAYWAVVLEKLPGAAVVFDRFHIMKLMNEKLDELRRALVREATRTASLPYTVPAIDLGAPIGSESHAVLGWKWRDRT